MTETVTASQEVQVETDEVGPDEQYAGDGSSMATTLSDELAIAPGTYTPIPAWPWASDGQFNNALYTQYNSQSGGTSQHCMGRLQSTIRWLGHAIPSFHTASPA